MDQFDILVKQLKKAKIPFEQHFNQGMQLKQLGYPNFDNKVCSVICGDFSYGGEQGFLEIMGLLTVEEEKQDSVLGWLTADNVFNRIRKHWETSTWRN